MRMHLHLHLHAHERKGREKESPHMRASLLLVLLRPQTVATSGTWGVGYAYVLFLFPFCWLLFRNQAQIPIIGISDGDHVRATPFDGSNSVREPQPSCGEAKTQHPAFWDECLYIMSNLFWALFFPFPHALRSVGQWDFRQALSAQVHQRRLCAYKQYGVF